MKHFQNFNDYKSVQEQIEKIKEITSLEELNEFEINLETLNLNEGVFKYVKSKIQKIKNFFSDSGKAFDYLLTGEDPEEEAQREYPEEILLIYNEPTGNGKDTYIVYNGDDATEHKFNYSSIFNSFNLKPEMFGNLKDTPSVKVSSIYDRNTRKRSEYAISLYALLEEVDPDLYGHGHIEDVTPSIQIYLKNLKPNYEQRLMDYYKKLLTLPKFYDKKIHSNFDEKVLTKALNSVKLDMKRNN